MLLLGLLLGCPGSGDDSGAPSLVLVSPADGDVVCGTPFEIVTEVENFELVPVGDYGDDVDPGVGHVHAYLNGQEVANAFEEAFFISAVEDGEYQLRVELGLANHDALEPYVGTTIYLTVDNTRCSP